MVSPLALTPNPSPPGGGQLKTLIESRFMTRLSRIEGPASNAAQVVTVPKGQAPVAPVGLPALPRLAKRVLADQQAGGRAARLTPGAVVRQGLRETLVKKALEIALNEQCSPSRACEVLIERIQTGREGAEVLEAARRLARGDSNCPHRARFIDWVMEYQRKGRDALADRLKGRKRQWYGWEPDALQYWLSHNQVMPATVAYWLREEGHASATNSRVRSFIDALPERLGAYSAPRVGAHHYQQNRTPHVIRDYS